MVLAEKRISVMGAPLDALTKQETVDLVRRHLQQPHPDPWQHACLNAATYVAMQDDSLLRQAICASDIVSADGQSIVWAAALLGKRLPERVPGPDLMEDIVKMCAADGYSIYMLGATQEVVTKVVDVYQRRYPALRIAGWRNGYWDAAEESAVVDGIKAARPDVLFVAISSPKKETFLAKHLKELDVPFTMGVGGAFDIVAGHIARAPHSWQKLGLEWLYRFIQEPRRMWRRYTIGNLRFLGYLLRHKLIQSFSRYSE